MNSLNRASIIGNLGRDPEIRTTQGGKKVSNLSVATTDKWMDKNTGELKERTEWHRVVCFDKLADFTEYLKSGSRVFIEGKLQTRKWTDQSGQEKYTTEIVCQGFDGKIMGLDKKGEGSQQGGLDDSIPFAPHRGW